MKFQDIFPEIEISPARAAAFGAAVGGLFALAMLNLFGFVLVDALGVGPLTTLVVFCQVFGAAVAWLKARD